jgi:hypothetical protein
MPFKGEKIRTERDIIRDLVDSLYCLSAESEIYWELVLLKVNNLLYEDVQWRYL